MILSGLTITPGITISNPAPASGLVTSGLVMNLATAPSSGTTWTDATGNGNNATLVTTGSGTLTYTATNGGGIVMGSAVSSQVIATSYNLGTAFTVEMWCQPAAVTYWSTLWGNDIYSTKGYWAYWNSSTTMVAGGVPGGYAYTISSNPGVVKQYTFTLTGTTFTFYLNGVAQTPSSGSFSSPSGGAGTTGLNFGSRHPNSTGTASTPTDNLTGTYYQMRVYNRALTSAEVNQNFTTFHSTYGI